jgi:hypothetical protein
MQHWAYTVEAAAAIVAGKAKTMNYEKYAVYFFVACLALWALELYLKTQSPGPRSPGPSDYERGFRAGWRERAATAQAAG